MFPDSQLVEQARNGCMSSFTSLLAEGIKKSRGAAIRICGPDDYDGVDDVIQEASLKAFKAIKNFKGHCTFSTWFYRIVESKALMRLRARRLNAPRERSLYGLEQKALVPPIVLDFDKQKMMDEILGVVAKISTKGQIIFLARYTQGMTYQEIAESLGMSLSTVKAYVHRTKIKIREELQIEHGVSNIPVHAASRLQNTDARTSVR